MGVQVSLDQKKGKGREETRRGDETRKEEARRGEQEGK